MEQHIGKIASPSERYRLRRQCAVLALAAAVLFSMLLVALLYRISAPNGHIPSQPTIERAADKIAFKRLLKKHGLDREISVILEDPLGQYYIRNGRRYKFQ